MAASSDKGGTRPDESSWPPKEDECCIQGCGWWYDYLIDILHWLTCACLEMRPPSMERFIRFCVFQPPKRFHYYFLIGDENGKRERLEDAKRAQQSRNLVLCLPHLLKPAFRTTDVMDQLMRVKVHLIPTTKEECLVSIYASCRDSINGRMRSPCVILCAQPNNSDVGYSMLCSPTLVEIADYLRCDLIAFDYCGYGLSTGECNEENVYDNVESVFRYITNVLKFEASNVILIGFSMGTAAAIHLAVQQQQIPGLILVAPFTSFMRLLLRNPRKERTSPRDQFVSYDNAPQVISKVLICHGGRDYVAPASHGRVLYNRFPNKSEFCIVEGASHTGIYGNLKLWERMQRFVCDELGVADRWNGVVSS